MRLVVIILAVSAVGVCLSCLRFRHCKFTKANFPSKEEGAKKLAKPIAQAFSSTIGWARESLILLIPAALKINPQLAYVMIGLLGVMMLLVVLRMLFPSQHVTIPLRQRVLPLPICAFARVLILTKTLIYIFTLLLASYGLLFREGVLWMFCRHLPLPRGIALAFFHRYTLHAASHRADGQPVQAGLATAVLLSPLTKPLMDREPNNVRNWGLKGPGGGGGEEYAPIAFVGVFEMSKLNEYVLSVDTSYMLGSLDEESGEVYTGYLDLGTPALSVTMNAARKGEEWGTGLRRFVDGLTLFRIAQILRIGIHVKGNREMQRLELYLSILGSGYLMGAEKSGRHEAKIKRIFLAMIFGEGGGEGLLADCFSHGEFWKRVLGIGIGEAVIRDDHETNKISVSAKCEKGESSLLCSASGDGTIAGSLDLIPLMTKQHGVEEACV
eukprot:jgi/Bigna1/72089/fgenesh1_pg.18_\